MSPWSPNNPLVRMLVVHEGLSLKPYKDTVGKLTIGIGRNLDDVGISPAEAYGLLFHDLDRVFDSCKKEFPWFDSLNEARQAVIVSMVFNIGLSGFKGFSKMLAAIAASQWDMAADEMLSSKWAFQVKTRALELASMMRKGRFQS